MTENSFSQNQFSLDPVIVVGAGFSGIATAYELKKQGFPVKVIAPHSGMTQFWSGALDWIDPRILSPQMRWSDLPFMAEAMDRFCEAFPLHALNDYFQDKSVGESLAHIHQNVLSWMNELGYECDGDGQNYRVCFGPTGVPKYVGWAQKGYSFDVATVSRATRVTILGFDHLNDFSLDLQRKVLNQYFSEVSVVSLPQVLHPQNGWTDLLQKCDDDLFCENLLQEWLKSYTPTDLVFVPPCFKKSKLMIKKIEEMWNAPASYFLPMTPSLMGLSWPTAVSNLLNKSDIEWIQGTVTELPTLQNSLLTYKIGNEISAIRPQAVFLATGKFASQGFEITTESLKNKKAGQFIDRLTGLILQTGERSAENKSPMDLIHRDPKKRQDIFNLGLPAQVLQNQSPVPIYCVGQARYEADIFREHCAFSNSFLSGLHGVRLYRNEIEKASKL